MKPRQRIAAARTPDGEELTLYRQGADYSIQVKRQELMTSRAHESEVALARLGCARLAGHRNPAVLVGGLGMGYTVRAALDLLGAGARVVVGELIGAVVAWNRDYLGDLAGHPLRDARVEVRVGDVGAVIRASAGAFDAILLDVDNGPEAFTDARNAWLYSREGLRACLDALHAKGCLAIWSGFAAADAGFERRLRQERLHYRRVPVPAYKGARTLSRGIWLVARAPGSLPSPEARS